MDDLTLTLTLTLTLIFLHLSLSSAIPSASSPSLPPLNHIISEPAALTLHSPPISRSHQNHPPKPISRRRHRPPPPPPPPEKLNLGKKLGLLFAAIAAALQVSFAAFLVYKRRQLKKMGRSYRITVSS